MTYRAPVKDMLFVMQELAGIDAVSRLPGFEDAGFDTAQAVLEECAKFNEGVIAPLNRDGDVAPSTWKDGAVTTTAGFIPARTVIWAAGVRARVAACRRKTRAAIPSRYGRSRTHAGACQATRPGQWATAASSGGHSVWRR